MELYDRNALTWDDDRKAAAFVTAKDPQILEQYADAKNNYARLAALDPELADRFAYLGGAENSSARASAAESGEGIFIWDEECCGLLLRKGEIITNGLLFTVIVLELV